MAVGSCGDPHTSVWIDNNSGDSVVVYIHRNNSAYPAFLVPAHAKGVGSDTGDTTGEVVVYRANDCFILGRDQAATLMVITVPESGVPVVERGKSRNTVPYPSLQIQAATCQV